ncbi:hypothetical protein LJF28_04895 [Chryseobacterium indologenes]|nr:hypothetical protein [Chryseobacterium indologenes]UDQ55007.1 hypothetical protein LJF28_04895 [Chryseobacterium indologenes]
MAFLTKEELQTITTIEIIDLITNKNDDIVGGNHQRGHQPYENIFR